MVLMADKLAVIILQLNTAGEHEQQLNLEVNVGGRQVNY